MKTDKGLVDIKDWCEAHGVLYAHFASSSLGWPNTVVMFPGGFHLWLSLNTTGKSLGSMQLFRLSQMATMGVLAVVFNDVDSALDYLNDCLESAVTVMEEKTHPPKKKDNLIVLPTGVKKDDEVD